MRVRRAVAHAIDVQSIIDNVLYGFAARNGTPVPTGNFGHDPDLARLTPGYDPAAAGRLLDEAGFSLGPDGVRRKGGQSLQVNLWVLSVLDPVGQVVQEQLQEVGFQVRITSLDVATYTSQVAAGDVNLEIISVGWPAPTILKIMSALGWGSGLYDDPRLVDQLARAERAVDDGERAGLYREAQRLILEGMAIVPLYTPVGAALVRREVKDLRFDPLGAVLSNDAYVER